MKDISKQLGKVFSVRICGNLYLTVANKNFVKTFPKKILSYQDLRSAIYFWLEKLSSDGKNCPDEQDPRPSSVPAQKAGALLCNNTFISAKLSKNFSC